MDNIRGVMKIFKEEIIYMQKIGAILGHFLWDIGLIFQFERVSFI